MAKTFMKDTSLLSETKIMQATRATNAALRKTLRGGAHAIVKQFKQRQLLPVVGMPEGKDWPSNVPPDGLDLGSFYCL
jgi:hypothetical protein